jgi:hypothetical protein
LTTTSQYQIDPDGSLTTSISRQLCIQALLFESRWVGPAIRRKHDWLGSVRWDLTLNVGRLIINELARFIDIRVVRIMTLPSLGAGAILKDW